jgi:hypothetical protein
MIGSDPGDHVAPTLHRKTPSQRRIGPQHEIAAGLLHFKRPRERRGLLRRAGSVWKRGVRKSQRSGTRQSSDGATGFRKSGAFRDELPDKAYCIRDQLPKNVMDGGVTNRTHVASRAIQLRQVKAQREKSSYVALRHSSLSSPRRTTGGRPPGRSCGCRVTSAVFPRPHPCATQPSKEIFKCDTSVKPNVSQVPEGGPCNSKRWSSGKCSPPT